MDHQRGIDRQRPIALYALAMLSAHVDGLNQDFHVDGSQEKCGPKVKWQVALRFLEECRLKGARFTTQEDMAERVGCSPATISKAILEKGSVELQEWAKRQSSVSRLNLLPEAANVALKAIPQSREPDPSDVTEQSDVDAATKFLVAQALRTGGSEAADKAEAQIQAMDDAQRRSLAEMIYKDPDRAEQAERYLQSGRSKTRT